jgi:hypothetical protein
MVSSLASHFKPIKNGDLLACSVFMILKVSNKLADCAVGRHGSIAQLKTSSPLSFGFDTAVQNRLTLRPFDASVTLCSRWRRRSAWCIISHFLALLWPTFGELHTKATDQAFSFGFFLFSPSSGEEWLLLVVG